MTEPINNPTSSDSNNEEDQSDSEEGRIRSTSKEGRLRSSSGNNAMLANKPFVARKKYFNIFKITSLIVT